VCNVFISRKFINQVSTGKTIQQYGDGTSSRDYTYVSDIVNGIIRALDRPLGYRVYNLGKGSGTSLKDLLVMVETRIGKKAIVEVLPDQPGDVPYTCANISIASRVLGYNASFPTDVGVAKTVEWYLETYPPSAAASPSANMRKLQRSSRIKPSLTTLLHDVDDDSVPRERPRRRKLLGYMQRDDVRKTVLVSGGTRFLGSHVVEALLDRGDRVILVDQMELTDQNRYNLDRLLEQYGENDRMMVHLGNLTDATFLRAVFEIEAPQWICQLAGPVEDSMSFNESIETVEQIINPTLHLLEMSKGKRHGGFDVENFVILGSSKVYGDRTNDYGLSLPNEEDRVDAPLTPYAASKKSEELLSYTYHHLYDIPTSILRVDSMFGPRHDLHSRSFDQFHIFLQNAATMSATGAAEEDIPDDNWIYVGEVVTALLSALDHQHDYEIFNVAGSNCPHTFHSVFRLLGNTSLGIPAVEGDRRRKPCLSMEKTKQKLQHKPSVTHLEGTIVTIKWHRELFSRISVASENPFASMARSSGSTKSNSSVHYITGAKVKQGWGFMRDIAYFQWAVVIALVLYRSLRHQNRSPRGRSPTAATF
jgi:nucleoside-diphosphate-sugar epimerase